jgi:hypothetical protein
MSMARDLDRLLVDYAEDALFISNLAPGAICGAAALRQFWTQAPAIFTPQVLSMLKFVQQDFERDIAHILWSAGTVIPIGSDTFVPRNGKLVAQTGIVQIAGPQ